MNELPERSVGIPARHVAAVVVGNALEFYDFLTYAYFAVYIGRAFFPSSSPSSSLLASLATFGVGFVTRPIGGVVIGWIGDRVGRKPAMLLSFSLMGVAIVGLALTPPRSMIGIAAPLLVILFRMVQGFALGGEVGPATAFMLEAAPPQRRGFYTAFQPWTQSVSILISGLIGFGLSNILDDRQLQAFGWRIAFLIGAAIIPFGLMVRRSLPETFDRREATEPERIPLRPYLSVAVLGLLILASATIGSYVRTYMTTYAIAILHMPARVAFAATIIVGLGGIVVILPSGMLSDRIGRKPVIIIFATLCSFSILPAFQIIERHRTPSALLGCVAVLSILGESWGSPLITWLAESLPAPIRASGLSIVYAVAIAAFGGTTQYTITWIIKVTSNPLAPAYYWTAAAVVGLAAAVLTRESSVCPFAKREAATAELVDDSGATSYAASNNRRS
jgi:MFS transporter, MHS family, citrate/tricarballylate:H+ symporter